MSSKLAQELETSYDCQGLPADFCSQALKSPNYQTIGGDVFSMSGPPSVKLISVTESATGHSSPHFPYDAMWTPIPYK